MSLKTRAGFHDSRPADQGGHAPPAFPIGVLLATERRRAGIREQADHRAIVRRVNHDGVLGQPEFVDCVEQRADEGVVFDHAVGVESKCPVLPEILLPSRA